MNPSGQAQPFRSLSIDILRGFALVCMVVIHFIIYFGDAQAVTTWLYFGFNHLLGDWGASSFLIIMGISQVFSGQKYADGDVNTLLKRTLIRGVFIFLIGLLMLALTWGPTHLWKWDILTLIGFATIILFFCRWIPSWCLLGLASLIAIVTPFLRGQLAIAAAWNANLLPVPVISDYFPNLLFDPAQEPETSWSLSSIIQGFLFTGEFPVFPWMLFPLVGFVLGRRMTAQKISKDIPCILILSVVLVVLGMGIAYQGSLRPGVSVISDYITPLSFYPDSFSIVFVQMGLSLSVITLTYYFLDVRKNSERKPGRIATFFIRTGQSSLTFYFMHYLLIGWPLAILYLLSGKYYIYDLLGAWPALGAGLTAVALLSFLLWQWQKCGGKYTLEWFLYAAIRRFSS